MVTLAKKKAVFSADPTQLEKIQKVVRSRRYRSASEFLREAIDEKLERLHRDVLAEQVARYCAKGYAQEDEGLIDAQAIDLDR
jgi:Arc/MetJ-type ribon-helix-helix transcriptional regulator